MSSGLRFHFPGFLEAEPGAPPARKPEPQPKPAQAWEADLEELSSDEGSDEGGGAAVAVSGSAPVQAGISAEGSAGWQVDIWRGSAGASADQF